MAVRIAQVYPHADIPVPHTRLYDALAIVNYEIGRRLARRHEVVTYPKWVPGQSELESHEGVTYRRIPQGIDRLLSSLKALDTVGLRSRRRPFRLSPLYYAHYAREVSRDIAERRCDLVHLHTISNFIGPIRRANPRARIVLHMHDHSLADFDPEVIAPRLEEVALILACSRFVADEIRRLYPAAAERCHELYNGVDERFLELAAAPAASQTVLFVGRLCPEKGVHVLLSAMSEVLRAHPRAGLGLVGPLDVAPKDFVDPHRRDPLFDSLLQYYGRPNDYYDLVCRQVSALDGHAVLHGRASNHEIGAHYARAGIFVFPSIWHEPFGIPVIEAMAAGLPVVATRAGAIPEVVVDGETGILVERGDTDGLAAAISRLLADPHLRARMGNAGRERVKRLFTWERSVGRLQELYDGARGVGKALPSEADERAIASHHI
ncbi:MAG TPA: glycosyltransferase family 4 protein [Steroidobacteraceae bacterium]|nr:glycosyltransferase family 4 protein [Steroidobacteraceae bacterium]